MVLRVDEKTSKQPRPRQAPTPRKNSDILTWPSFALMSRCSKVGWVKGQVKMSGFVVTLPAQPKLPVRVEHEYQRKGALNLFAAFDTRTGKVWGQTYERKRQEEFIAFLSYLDREIPPTVTLVHIVLDNLRMHKGKKVQAWLVKHPRFVLHHPPVHCSWMNQVEQWFSILQRKRLRIADFADKQALAERLERVHC